MESIEKNLLTLSALKTAVGVLATGLLLGLVATPAAQAAPFKPELKKCRLVKKLEAKRACQKHNRATRKVFNQIKNSRFVGSFSKGVPINAVYCANGKWVIWVRPDTEELRFSGHGWTIQQPHVGRSMISAIITGPSNSIYTRIALQRRGPQQWHLISDLEPSKASKVTRTSAAKYCKKL